MKQTFVFFAVALLVAPLAHSTGYNLGELARSNQLEVFNRTLKENKGQWPETIFLDAASGDGLAWIAGVELSGGTIEVEIKGKNEQGRSFVGIVFHGQDDRAFDAVYVRPFNFQSAEQDRRSRRQIAGPILQEALVLALAGVVIAIPLTLALTQIVRGSFYGVQPSDPVTFCGAIGLFVVVALLAAWIPAGRATKVDPIISLRTD